MSVEINLNVAVWNCLLVNGMNDYMTIDVFISLQGKRDPDIIFWPDGVCQKIELKKK